MPLRVPASASALALVLALSAAAAHAQGQSAAQAQPASQGNTAGNTQPPADPPARAKKSRQPEVLRMVVVTGLRQSLMSAEAIKRLAPQIVDSVTAEDIGALPDRSVAEALERIPGVLIERTDNNRDPARLTDEGGNVFIRGLSWVQSELDGEEIFSANDGREISFEDISPDLLSGIDVFKTPTADQIEGGIGGVIDMKTRKPLESRHNLTAFSADYEYGDMIKKAYPTVNGLWSNYWETGIGKVGVLLSGTYAREGNRTDSIQTGDFVSQTLPQAEAGLPAGSTVYVPNALGWRRLDWQQNRQALDGVFQWESPNDKWVLTAHAFQAKDDPINLEHSEGSYGEYIGAPGTSPAAGCSGYCPSADYTAVNSSGVVTAGNVWFTPQLDTRYEKDHHSTNDFTLNLTYSPTDRLTLSGDVQYVKSHADMVSMTAYTQVGNPVTGAPLGGGSGGQFINFNLAGNNPTMVMNQSPYEMTDPNDYWWCCAMDHIEDNDAHQWAERLDGTFKFEDNPWLKDFRFGTRFEDRRATTRESNWNWSLLSWDYTFGGTPVPITQTPGFATQLEPFNDFMRGSVSFPGVGIFPSYQLVRNGTAYAYSILKGTENAGWGWSPLTTDWSKYNPASGDNPINGINDQAEHTYAGYIETDFHHDQTPIGPMDGNIGVRVVRTVNAPATGIINLSAIQVGGGCPQPTYTAAQCQFYNNAVAFSAGGAAFPAEFPENSYTNALPSFNVRFLLTHDLQWRVAASQSMTQPTFSQMVPFGTVGFNFIGSTPLAKEPYPTTGTFGDPELKPILANNYDSSLEWYFGPAAELTFDVFYKQIRNYIFTANGGTGQSPTVTLTHNGVSEDFNVVKAVNGSYGTLRGAELQYQQFYTFLPGPLKGIGLEGNLTFVGNSGGANNAQNAFDSNQVAGANNTKLPMEGMSRWSYNLALMYQAYSLEGRIAWNWRERYLLTTSAANLNEPVWMDNYGQLDGELFYDVTDYLKVGLQGTNLLRGRSYLEVGPGPNAPVIGPYSWTDTDRTVALSVRLQF